MEAIILTAFISLQIAAKALPKLASQVAHWAIIQRISQNHWVVWLFHPVVVHGVHEYAVHFVVYSGYVIRSH